MSIILVRGAKGSLKVLSNCCSVVRRLECRRCIDSTSIPPAHASYKDFSSTTAGRNVITRNITTKIIDTL